MSGVQIRYELPRSADTELGPTRLQHPKWIQDQITKPYDQMTMVVCKDLIPLSIERFTQQIGLGGFNLNDPKNNMYRISYFTKSGCPQIADYCPTALDFVVSAGNMVENVKKFPNRKFRLYIGKPNEVDAASGYLKVVTPAQLTDLMMQLTPTQCRQIEEILFDGNFPKEEFPDFATYFRKMRSQQLIQSRPACFRINTQIKRNDQRHGQTPQLDFIQAAKINSLNAPHSQGGYNVYAGNPFTAELADELARSLNLPELNSDEPWYVPRIKIGKGDEDYIGFPPKIYLGGFGGFGDKVPFDALTKLILRIKKASPTTEVILELGTKLVEDCSVLVSPRKPSEITLNDVEQGMSDMIFTELPNIGTVILRPVSYAYWQQKLPVDVV